MSIGMKIIKFSSSTTRTKKTLSSTNVAIFGGGIMGTSIAYFLKQQTNFTVTVFERDPNYTRASTTLSVGGIRQQFSLTENIQMSMFSSKFLDNIKQHLSIKDFDPPDICLKRKGYLTLANHKQADRLLKNYQIQIDHGAQLELMSKKQIQKRFPMINCDDIELAVYGTENEGWFDPYQFLMAMKNKAIFLGAKFVHATVQGFQHQNSLCDEVLLKKPNGSEENIKFDIGIICAGYDSRQLASMLGYGSKQSKDIRHGIDFPIEPRKRYVFVFNCKDQKPDWDFPFLIDNSGVYCRQEGMAGHFICGRSPMTDADEPNTDNFEVDYSYFDQQIHQLLAHRVPAFEAIKIKSAWAGFYEYNRLDQNPVIGPDPFFSNIYWATGFSGHGIQMAPALGRAMMEYILFGNYQTIDLTRFSWNRIIDNRPLKELNVY